MLRFILIFSFTMPLVAQSFTDAQTAQIINRTIQVLEKNGLYGRKLTREDRDDFIKLSINIADPTNVYLSESDRTELGQMELPISSTIAPDEIPLLQSFYETLRQKQLAQIQVIHRLIDQEDGRDSDDRFRFRLLGGISENGSTLADRQRKYVKYRVLRLMASGSNLEDAKRELRRNLEQWERRTLKVDNQILIERFFHTYFRLTDPQAAYISQGRESDRMAVLGQRLTGIGVQLKQNLDMIEIINIFPDGSAGQSGKLLPGDRIIAVQPQDSVKRDVIGWRMEDVVPLILGKANTNVTLTLVRAAENGFSEPFEVTLTRKPFSPPIEYVSSQTRSGTRGGNRINTAIIKIPSLYKDQASNRDAYLDFVKELMMHQNADGLVLDLRNNRGGYFNLLAPIIGQITGTADLYLQKRKNASATGKSTGLKRNFTKPIVVLTDAMTSGGAEMMVSALSSNNVAVIVGKHTYGATNIRSRMVLDQVTGVPGSGSVLYTTIGIYHLDGSPINYVGIKPDIELPDLLSSDETGARALLTGYEPRVIDAASYEPVVKSKPPIALLNQKHQQRLDGNEYFNRLNGMRMERLSMVESNAIILNRAFFADRIDNNTAMAPSETDHDLEEAIQILLDWIELKR